MFAVANIATPSVSALENVLEPVAFAEHAPSQPLVPVLEKIAKTIAPDQECHRASDFLIKTGQCTRGGRIGQTASDPQSQEMIKVILKVAI